MQTNRVRTSYHTTMKQALKLILSTLFGACIGFGAMVLCITFFTETTLSEFFGNMGNIQLSRLLLSCILSLACLILAVFVQIILHEGGHLIFGLATGYRFVSFRVGSLTLIKEKESSVSNVSPSPARADNACSRHRISLTNSCLISGIMQAEY